MALTPQELELLKQLQAKETAPEEAPKFDSIEKIVEYLVQTSSHFTANPQDREEILAFLDNLIRPKDSETPEETS